VAQYGYIENNLGWRPVFIVVFECSMNVATVHLFSLSIGPHEMFIR
jgi:hypothetical protein